MLLVLWNSLIIWRIAGAIIDEARGVRKERKERRAMLVYFFVGVQFSGFLGSVGLSQKTMLEFWTSF